MSDEARTALDGIPVMDINIPLLRKVMCHAVHHPDEINLGSWGIQYECGTVACIATWTVIFAGYEIDWDYGDRIVTGERICDVAARELRIDDEDADDLFFCASLNEAWRIVETITDGAVTRQLLNETQNTEE